MSNRIKYILLLALALSVGSLLNAQETPNENWEAQKIKGVRYLLDAVYNGFPFLNDSWLPGRIEFADGEIADSIYMRYSSYKDELIYFNKSISAQIMIDKASLNGFWVADKDKKMHVFRKQYFDGFIKGDRYFEVLTDGETKLLAYRKVNLTATTPYHDINGILKNMEYTTDHQFYFYSPEKGYTPVRLNRSALLAKFVKTDQKAIKKLLRKNRMQILDEDSFIDAWKTTEKDGFKVVF